MLEFFFTYFFSILVLDNTFALQFLEYYPWNEFVLTSFPSPLPFFFFLICTPLELIDLRIIQIIIAPMNRDEMV